MLCMNLQCLLVVSHDQEPRLSIDPHTYITQKKGRDSFQIRTHTCLILLLHKEEEEEEEEQVEEGEEEEEEEYEEEGSAEAMAGVEIAMESEAESNTHAGKSRKTEENEREPLSVFSLSLCFLSVFSLCFFRDFSFISPNTLFPFAILFPLFPQNTTLSFTFFCFICPPMPL